MLPNEVFALACRERYAEDGLVVDESNGEFAHCPLPRSMGDSGYYLLHEDHQWQGLLQSKDLGRRCYYTYHVKRWLMKANFVTGYFDLWDIYDEFSKPFEVPRPNVGHPGRAIIASKPCGSEIRYESVRGTQGELGANTNISRYLKSGKIVAKGKLKGWKFRYA